MEEPLGHAAPKSHSVALTSMGSSGNGAYPQKGGGVSNSSGILERDEHIPQNLYHHHQKNASSFVIPAEFRAAQQIFSSKYSASKNKNNSTLMSGQHETNASDSFIDNASGVQGSIGG